MNKTPIEWVKNPDGTQGYTWNPITGCLNHTNGKCKGGNFPCYAHRLANGRLKQRYLANENTIMRFSNGYAPTKLKVTDPFYPRFWPEKMIELWRDAVNERRQKPRGIFVCDMSDLFGIGIPYEWTEEIMACIKGCDQHRFYLLTKQPQNLIRFSPFPDNCWVGVTATNEHQFVEAGYHLNQIEARLKYISIEPYLERIPIGDFPMPSVFNWVIIGGQTRPYRPPKLEWVEEMVTAGDKAGISVFLKDNLEPLRNQLYATFQFPHIGNKTNLLDAQGRLRQEMSGV